MNKIESRKLKELRELFPTDMRKFNHWGNRQKDKLIEQVNVMVTPKQKRGINLLVESGKFPNKSEFIRYLIVRYFDEI